MPPASPLQIIWRARPKSCRKEDSQRNARALTYERGAGTTSSPPSLHIGTSLDRPIRHASEDDAGGHSINGRDSTMAETGTLHDAFIDELRDTYDAEKQLTKALPKLAKAANDAKLRTAFETHLQETQGQIGRLEQVFQSLDEPVRGKHCDGIAGIIEEGKSVMQEDFDENTMDACLIASGQRAEHYEMAAYGTLVAWAQAMGHTQAAKLLQETLDEEKAADKKLSGLAEGGINQSAADATHSEDEDAEPASVGAVAKKTPASKANSGNRR